MMWVTVPARPLALAMPKSAGLSFCRRVLNSPYSKRFLTIRNQVESLRQRGHAIPSATSSGALRTRHSLRMLRRYVEALGGRLEVTIVPGDAE